MDRQSFVAAIDQGTTGTRCSIFDRAGRQRASAYEEHRQIYPQPCWVEHDVAEIWAKTARVTRSALAQASPTAGDLAGLCITNQHETAVVWDAETGTPLANAIVWQGTRTLPQCQALIDGGCVPKIRWDDDLLQMLVAGAVGEQQAALAGQTCYTTGEAKNTQTCGAGVFAC